MDFRGLTCVVTGGTGTVGTSIVHRLLNSGAAKVRVFSRDESKQFAMKQALDVPALRYMIGDVRDRGRVLRVLSGADVVFHCAAMKHVPACEYDPAEAVKTNVLGTQNVVECAVEQGVKRVVYLSTDKAANPNNTMGATKLVAERLVTAGNYLSAYAPTTLASVRFGNVLGSRGSVLEAWDSQRNRKTPLLVTCPDMSRFAMRVSDAVDLCFHAAGTALGGEVFISKMPVFKLETLAEAYLAEKWPEGTYSIVGARPGETMYEDMLTAEEAPRTLDTGTHYVIMPTWMFKNRGCYQSTHHTEKIAAEPYMSDGQEAMTLEQTRAFLRPIVGV